MHTSVSLTIIFLSFLGTSARAQIVPDSTLRNNSAVNLVGSQWNITGGETVGNNLFHSFNTFNIGTGEAAIFDNAPTLQNIISRVTGGTGSTIDGLIQANGDSNLFLINPSGIILGSNAQLNLGGSFFGSTADSIVFSNGSSFSATNPQAAPLLAMNIPLGLQSGGNSVNLAVLEPDSQLLPSVSLTLNDTNIVVGVNNGQNLSDIELTNITIDLGESGGVTIQVQGTPIEIGNISPEITPTVNTPRIVLSGLEPNALNQFLGTVISNQLPSSAPISSTFTSNSLRIDSVTVLEQFLDDFANPSSQMALGCEAYGESRFVVTGRGGLPEDPTIPIRGQTLWRDMQAFSSTATGKGGDVSTQEIETSPPLVEAKSWQVNEAGNVELVAVLPQEIARAEILSCQN
ncbi:filamentous hemagglutinin N-terminal domain-containing protein [Lusitaniella coriacea LEGE 07157]|uniref:Filamentous hemagglutinin N-terminal domain-containing protein n=1 Tax=Lusitaniella coriacea LEGE 07157 TaxID=945747 RepID=A0A8J7ARX1_9CYAN|nr:filamentous hemagglutinin N-terminal domain-containing protein [Lusitaniella coriacea]MBE9115106.1 filamentous hemagglutinin N-terminal domain-containing protein [Lusitaniella coriacea LEGE 07157]